MVKRNCSYSFLALTYQQQHTMYEDHIRFSYACIHYTSRFIYAYFPRWKVMLIFGSKMDGLAMIICCIHVSTLLLILPFIYINSCVYESDPTHLLKTSPSLPNSLGISIIDWTNLMTYHQYIEADKGLCLFIPCL